MALTPSGVTHVYAGNTENPVFRFRLGRIGLVTTAIHSLDRSLFRYVVPAATDRRLLRPGQRSTWRPVPEGDTLFRTAAGAAGGPPRPAGRAALAAVPVASSWSA